MALYPCSISHKGTFTPSLDLCCAARLLSKLPCVFVVLIIISRSSTPKGSQSRSGKPRHWPVRSNDVAASGTLRQLINQVADPSLSTQVRLAVTGSGISGQ
jgi:hypothetical protein